MSRRIWIVLVVVVVLGAIAALPIRGWLHERAHPRIPRVPPTRPEVTAFLGDVRIGAPVERWTIAGIVDHTSKIEIDLAPASAEAFHVAVFRRSDAGLRPVATSKSLALFIDDMPLADAGGNIRLTPDQLEGTAALARALDAREAAGATVPALDSR